MEDPMEPDMREVPESSSSLRVTVIEILSVTGFVWKEM